MIKGIAILFIFLTVGEAISLISQLPIPGNVIGMLLLTMALHFKLVRLEDIRSVAEGLLKYLALFFVPPGVGLIVYFDLIKQEWLAIVLANVVSTVAVLLAVEILQQKLEKS